MIDFSCDCGKAQNTWTGTLTVAGAEFDTTPPTLAGAAAKTIRVPKTATRARVRYAVTARDAVDGSVPVKCIPPAGSWFGLGQTAVECSATDSSGNTRQATFKVTVKQG